MNASPPRRPSTAYRYLFVLGLGLLIDANQCGKPLF